MTTPDDTLTWSEILKDHPITIKLDSTDVSALLGLYYCQPSTFPHRVYIAGLLWKIQIAIIEQVEESKPTSQLLSQLYTVEKCLRALDHPVDNSRPHEAVVYDDGWFLHLLNSYLDPLLGKLLRIREVIDASCLHDVQVQQGSELLQEIRRIQPRKSIPKSVRDIHHAFLNARGGCCPCCAKERLINEDGHLRETAQCDHYYGRDRNKLHETWIVCQRCNSRLYSDPAVHAQKLNTFRVYQEQLSDFIRGTHQSELFDRKE